MSVPRSLRTATFLGSFLPVALYASAAQAADGSMLLGGGNLEGHVQQGVELLVDLCDLGLGAIWVESLGWLGLHPHDVAPPCAGFRVFDLGFLGLVALAIVLALRLRHATSKRRLDLARQMVERGMEPPENLTGRDPGEDLRRGLVLVFSGLGIVLASFFGRGEASAAGLVPGFIGLGYLASHLFSRRDRAGPGGGHA